MKNRILMVIVSVLICSWLIMSCTDGSNENSLEEVGDSGIYYLHDDVHGVGIWWKASSDSISVLPDNEYNIGWEYDRNKY